ncbi:hypothetical protein GOBAR_AA06554 [Gossypium barbadense]|uniref:Uncharacterized protein n=1 Tax=Gossypium barbadense TaxID=3634 RepID=A0A2P5YEK5_GOSBA|nr:hypothetical protein GOBAR_AA06554 [Gossypium barbadense]
MLLKVLEGKSPQEREGSAVPGGDDVVHFTLVVPLALLAPVCVSLSTETSFRMVRSVVHASLIGSLNFTSPDGEVNTFFYWRDHLGVERYPFSLGVVRKKWEEYMPRDHLVLGCLL